MDFSNTVLSLTNRPTNNQLESIDQTIICILNIARKKVKEPRRNILLLKEKEKRRSCKLYWNMKKKQINRK